MSAGTGRDSAEGGARGLRAVPEAAGAAALGAPSPQGAVTEPSTEMPGGVFKIM